jgi:hypothetical protein
MRDIIKWLEEEKGYVQQISQFPPSSEDVAKNKRM